MLRGIGPFQALIGKICAENNKCLKDILIMTRAQVHPQSWFDWQQCPKPREVEILSKQFSSPKETLTQLLHPLVLGDDSFQPILEVKERLGGLRWRAYLTLKWPDQFCVCGDSTDPQKAVYYAYLRACEMMVDMGVLTSNGAIIDCKAKLLEVPNMLRYRPRFRHPIKISSCRDFVEGKPLWTSTLDIEWPIQVSATGCSVTQGLAEQVASRVAFHKLKGKGLLNSSNMAIKEPNVILIPNSPVYGTQFEPDYEFYVDASATGYGAYLLVPRSNSGISLEAEPSMERRSHQVHWIMEKWPDHMEEKFLGSNPRSQFLEFYAILATLYTWKKKFQGAKVLCWSDSLSCVEMVNGGMGVTRKLNSEKAPRKLFEVLHNTVLRYDIQLRCKHVSRIFNRAADSLSKSQLHHFLQIVPNAAKQNKKSKKLDFFLPLT